jgi:uncharacterized protein YwqG
MDQGKRCLNENTLNDNKVVIYHKDVNINLHDKVKANEFQSHYDSVYSFLVEQPRCAELNNVKLHVDNGQAQTNIHIGGKPYTMQDPDGIEYNKKTEMLLFHANDMIGSCNIFIKKTDLKNCIFSNVQCEGSYD